MRAEHVRAKPAGPSQLGARLCSGLSAPAAAPGGGVGEGQGGEKGHAEGDENELDRDDQERHPPHPARPWRLRGCLGDGNGVDHDGSLCRKTKARATAKRFARPATLQDVQVALVREVPQGLTRAEWLLACEASYPKVYRALIAMGASPEDAADALQDAFEDALGEHGVVAKPEGWMFVVASRAWKRHRWRNRIFRPLAALRHAAHIASRDGEIDLLVELAKLTERQREVIVSATSSDCPKPRPPSFCRSRPGPWPPRLTRRPDFCANAFWEGRNDRRARRHLAAGLRRASSSRASSTASSASAFRKSSYGRGCGGPGLGRRVRVRRRRQRDGRCGW